MSNKNLETLSVQGLLIAGSPFRPNQTEDDYGNPITPIYVIQLVIDDITATAVTTAISRKMVATWGEDHRNHASQIWGVQHGSDPSYEQTYDKLYIRPKVRFRPRVFYKNIESDRFELIPDDPNETIIYPGCVVGATIEVYCYERRDRRNRLTKGATLSFHDVVLIQQGEHLYPKVSPDQAFSGLEIPGFNPFSSQGAYRPQPSPYQDNIAQPANQGTHRPQPSPYQDNIAQPANQASQDFQDPSFDTREENFDDDIPF
ncbi:MAG: DUF2815 family protein [Candidatus Thiodiazotropha endolucinida]|nr:DUF2815 family protein [Candidatus Thiodiazotropha taylori]MCW4323547.1 DUF2815 family protein [Candidatus Thiodiazotropha taylori]